MALFLITMVTITNTGETATSARVMVAKDAEAVAADAREATTKLSMTQQVVTSCQELDVEHLKALLQSGQTSFVKELEPDAAWPEILA